jgi:hypothetical protein
MVVRGPLCGTAIDGSCCVVVGNSTKVINFLQKKTLIKVGVPVGDVFPNAFGRIYKMFNTSPRRDKCNFKYDNYDIYSISPQYPHNIPTISRYPHDI